MSSWINLTSFDVKNEKWSENSKKYIDKLSGANTGLWNYTGYILPSLVAKCIHYYC